jgi:hypothetical protein
MSQERLAGMEASAPACVEIHRLLSSGMLSRLMDSCRSLRVSESQALPQMGSLGPLNSLSYGQVSHARLARGGPNQRLKCPSTFSFSGIRQLFFAGGGGTALDR